MRIVALLLVLVVSLPPRALAGPEVVASIAPVHSLVARVMQGAGTPHLLLPPGASPHDHALRPSDATALERAALVFWVGPRLERWLTRSLTTLAAGARLVRLADTPGLTRLALREGAVFEADGHGPAPELSEDQTDPHLWLDPMNAKLWLGAIAAALAEADPARRALYRANAEAARGEIDALVAEIDARLAPVRGRPFVVFHDSFHYFEHRFGIEAAGAVALGDARAPGPARIARIRDRIGALGTVCLFREPQFRASLVDTLAASAGVRIELLDPLGASLRPGPDLYPELLRGLADSLAGCLG
ncbi:MAG: zinc ABC transporter substrate-binding protein [Alphaproteobacteria bacterium]